MASSSKCLISLNPHLSGQARSAYRDFAKRLNGTLLKDLRECVDVELERANRYEAEADKLRACLSILGDLRVQGWEFRIDSKLNVWGGKPEPSAESQEREKSRIREMHLFERDNQLRQPGARQFVREMEKRRLGPTGWVSVFSLVRDGRDLAGRLRRAAKSPIGSGRADELDKCIDPYLQFVNDTAVCQFTGLRLMDVWRYFRYTWSIPYGSIPGRRMVLLVRDRAAENHPVVGIGAVGSALVQLTPRDEWIGWTSKSFIQELQESPRTEDARWLLGSLTKFIGGIYIKDFVKERILRRPDLRNPTLEMIERLREIAQEARERHHRFPKSSQHKSVRILEAGVWEEQARSALFRAKRAKLLADLLNARRNLLRTGLKAPTKKGLIAALNYGKGRHAIETILRSIKARYVGVNMLDITVCGAVQPYNAILGGKLVALLLTSPEVVKAYEARYANTPSIIASSMAGKAVCRKPQLVLLGTTSMYGISSSQYNRINLPAQEVGGRPVCSVRYELLGKTLGYGSYHLSAKTVDLLEGLLGQQSVGRRVNSIFGEGVSPRLRKMRDGLDLLGLPSDALLMHGSRRLIYGVSLAANFRKLLMGKASRPKYILPQSNPEGVSKAIAQFWIRRWLSKRVDRAEVLQELEKHSLVYPLKHGARVVLPLVEEEEPLFSSLEA